MSKVTFLPISIGGGLLAGMISKKLFGVIWGLIDEEEPPQAQHRQIHLGALALVVEGALSRRRRQEAGSVPSSPCLRTVRSAART